METLQQRIEPVVREEIAICPYDPRWPQLFLQEKEHLRSCLPTELVRRIEHFGSTAVPGLAAKPIIDMLVEVTDLQATRQRIAPALESQGYDYFWRPTETILYPYTVLFKGMVQAGGLLQLVSGSGKGQNL